MNGKTAGDLVGAGPDILTGNCRPAGTVAPTAASTLTMFSVLRPFPDGEADTDSDGLAKRQINAIRSWARLSPHVQLILFVERRDPILDRLANETGAEVNVVVTADGSPPKLDEVFAAARRACKSRVLMYSNGDMIYFPALLEVAHRLANESSGPFLAIGQRTGLELGEQLDGNSAETWSELELAARSKGRLASLVCKDFFLFPPELFSEMPPFRVGRGNWDNWMVWNARRKGIPVIDLTNQLLAVHQEHGYGHLAGGRRGAYLSSREARENRRLAGGRHLLAGSTSEWELTHAGISRKKGRLRKRIADIPRFLRLLRDLLFVGYFATAGSL